MNNPRARKIDPTWTLTAGTVVAMKTTVYGFPVVHVGVLSDGMGRDGARTVIHLSRRRNRAIEVPMIDFCDATPWWVVGYPSTSPPERVLERAQRDIAAERIWSLTSNCEHAVTRWHGLPERSVQLRRAIRRVLGIGHQPRILPHILPGIPTLIRA